MKSSRNWGALLLMGVVLWFGLQNGAQMTWSRFRTYATMAQCERTLLVLLRQKPEITMTCREEGDHVR